MILGFPAVAVGVVVRLATPEHNTRRVGLADAAMSQGKLI
jgi:hypothetical protein